MKCGRGLECLCSADVGRFERSSYIGQSVMLIFTSLVLIVCTISAIENHWSITYSGYSYSLFLQVGAWDLLCINFGPSVLGSL